jgi:hypothetical protein
MKVEKIKKTAEHWSSADVVDFEYFLIHTSSRENPTESAQQARHWFQQHVSDHSEEERAKLPDPKILKAWLTYQKKQHKGDLPLPGESWQWLMGMFHWLLVFGGLLSGAGVTISLLRYNGVQPINVAAFLGAIGWGSTYLELCLFHFDCWKRTAMDSCSNRVFIASISLSSALGL